MNAQPKHITYRRAPEEKRELLLAAARDLFINQGFEHTSTHQIAQHAGVSEGILFHHFGSKRGLFECVADEFVRASAEAAMPTDPVHLSEEAVVRAAFDFADQHPGLYQMLSQTSAVLAGSDTVARSEIIIHAIRDNLQRAMAMGLSRQGDANIMAELQFAMVDAAYKAWLKKGDPARREEYILEAVRCMQAMLAPESPDHSSADDIT
jgi:AcrR family transcriptional regulator